MVYGPKKQSFNKIISVKPTDATRANALPFNVGAKKSDGFANRLLSVAQPRPRRSSSQSSCEYFFIKDNVSEQFLDTVPQVGQFFALCKFNTGTSPYNEYKVKLVSTGKPNGSKYIVNKQGKYMSVLFDGFQTYYVTFEDKGGISLQEFIVTGTIGSTNATIQTADNTLGIPINLYLRKEGQNTAVFDQPGYNLSFPSASSTGC